ncbi:helix-turn-helix domain-containing protein [Neorhodopirellula pilleata]|uniref:Transcriptional regulatory protein ZraR n=1 Tax=Neorhodopirellula pilleata TaxID=2714738 RepID=A0A5C5ZXF7_9BACT|nr:helix-turn-helix domain-containing protein [Neorhodopirellula pilleata]TWT91835.1 Transcriptional regulatory protein ZraR [Neorhodopirellula pilleata]
MLDAADACVWLIDSDSSVVFVSDPMRAWLEIESDLPAEVVQALLPPSFARGLPAAVHGARSDRGHQTCRLVIPAMAAEDHVPLKTATAHFVVLGGGQSHPDSDCPTLILGCLGEFVSDADIPWEVWFGESGIRDAAEAADAISSMRAERKARCQTLMAGNSSISRRFRNRVDLACRVRSHVGLSGDPGSGMSELASVIHHGDADRANEPFVCLDASLMDAELLEVYASPAIVPLSDSESARSTLCLDRFDEMPRDGQDRLVQFLQTFPERLRLIGMMNADSDEPLADQLRDELHDAMCVLPITVPRLRERQEDLPAMAQSLARSTRLSREAIELVQTYPWPGQWDELVAAMRFAEEVVRGERITREHFPLAIRSFRVSNTSTAQAVRHETSVVITRKEEPLQAFRIESLDAALAAYESELITKAMQAAGGNKADAARRLGISRARLLRKLESE